MTDQNMDTTLLLSSTSTSRKVVLEKLQLPFQQIAPDVDETRLPNEVPADFVKRLSIAKAQAGWSLFMQRFPGTCSTCLSIGSDQIAICNGDILGKPGTAEKATAQLQQLSGNRVQFLTGLAVSDGKTTQYDYDETIVTMRSLSDDEIARYVELEQPLHAAGSFLSEALGIALFDRIETQDPNALIGLPLIALCRFLRDHNVNPLLP